MEGTEVGLVVIGNGSCDGESIGIDIYEDDLFADDFMGNPEEGNLINFSGNRS